MQSDRLLDRLVVSLHAMDSVETFVGNGFLVSPRHVLTTDAHIAAGSDVATTVLGVRFPGVPDAAPAKATLVQRVSEIGAALLELSAAAGPEVEVPPLDDRLPDASSRWRCAFVAPGSPGLVRVGGPVLAVGPLLLISPDSLAEGDSGGSSPPLWPPPIGAPIAIDERIAGMIVPPTEPETHGPPWMAVPAKRLLGTGAAAVWMAAPEPEPLDALLKRFGPSARLALEHANGIRQQQGQPSIHMEHLLSGLAEAPDGIPRRLLASSGIDQKALREIVKQAVGVALPTDYRPRLLTSLPSLSGHVRRALEGAPLGAEKRRPGIRQPALEPADLFFGALQVEDCSLIKPLREKGVTPDAVLAYEAPRAQGTQAPEHYILPDVGSDQPKGVDRLDITSEVEALATVVAAHDTDPPVAIGLFGEWGSGKSFFMEKMREKVEELAAEGRSRGDSSFCGEIVQIPFNAWHYVDANLWASLLTELFEVLSAHLQGTTGEASALKRARLLTRVASQKDVIAEAQKEKAAAESALQTATSRIQRLEQEQKRVEDTLSSGLMHEVLRELVLRQPTSEPVANETAQERERREREERDEESFRKQVEEAVEKLGVPVGQATPDLKAALVEAKGVVALWKAVSAGMSAPVAGALAVVVAAIAAYLAFRGSMVSWFMQAGPWIIPRLAAAATSLLVLSKAVATLEPWRRRVVEAMRILGRARRSHEAKNNAAKVKKKSDLEDEKKAIQRKATEAHAQVQQATEDLRTLEDELDSLRADRRMSEFIRERSTSTDYTRYQGIMARAQHDFERLSDLLKDVRYEADRRDLPTIDRIVLYIDDLDRCPEDKVFDVLQAVHLLLAYPLFVVVVGVDPRWLLHSLGTRAHALGEADRGDGRLTPLEPDSEWVATPMDYLEKIFQIPFTLRPMEQPGFSNLIDALAKSAAPATDTRTAPPPPPVPPPADPAPAAPPGALPAAVPGAPASGATPEGVPGGTPPPAPGPANSPSAAVAAAKAARKVERLQLSDPEREFMKGLFELIPSPRATKRFVNVYRLIRASAATTLDAFSQTEFDDLVGDEDWGDHRSVLLMLAILTGYPGQATDMLEALVARRHDETWWAFVESFRDRVAPPAAPPATATGPAADAERRGRERDAEQWQELFRKLELVQRRGDIPLHKSCWYFERWAPRVARYSFRSGRVLVAQRPRGGMEAPAVVAVALPSPPG